MKKRYGTAFAVIISIVTLVFVFFKSESNREYNVIADRYNITMSGHWSKYNTTEKTGKTKISFQKHKVLFYEKNGSQIRCSFVIGAGQTIHKHDTIITYLTGRLTDLARNDTRDEVIKIVSLKERRLSVSECNFDSICLNYSIPFEESKRIYEYQLQFPDSAYHKYVDSIFDMNQYVHSAADIKRKYHKNYQP